MGNWLERRWWILGAGRLGRALGHAARRADVGLEGVWNRTGQRAQVSQRKLGAARAISGALEDQLAAEELAGDVVWLTVVDDEIPSFAESIAEQLRDTALVLHGSGSLEAEVLRDAGIRAPVGSLHPLLAISDPGEAAGRFGEVAWTVEGDAEAVEFGNAFLGEFGASPLEITSGTRALYHAGAVVAANFAVALFDAALEMLEAAGIDRPRARSMLLPLLRSSVENLEEMPVEEALTGPAARGDEGTVERHRRALEKLDASELGALYEVLAARADAIARRSDGAEPDE